MQNVKNDEVINVISDWDGRVCLNQCDSIVDCLEAGKVLYFPNLSPSLTNEQRLLLDPSLVKNLVNKRSKNISLSAAGRVKGLNNRLSQKAIVRKQREVILSQKADVGQLHNKNLNEKALANKITDFPAKTIQELLNSFSNQSRSLINGLIPEYKRVLTAAPTSLRLHRVEMRQTSRRSDDKLLHIDAFPSRPVRDYRILRVFANINPYGEPRVWRMGETFENVATRFLPRLRPFHPLYSALMKKLGITKSQRTAYDHAMLGLHDAMKADNAYQQHFNDHVFPFAAGSVWICFSDQASHAVLSGQFMLEQSFFLRVQDMVNPANSPLKILERLTGRSLV